MAFRGYYIQVGSWQIPLSCMQIDSMENAPYKVMDLDPYYDANGLLHRNIVSHTSATLKFSTPPMTMSKKEEFFSLLRAQFTNTKKRDCHCVYYNEESGSYDEGDFYMAEPKFSASQKSLNGEILYNPIEIEFIKY